VLGTTDKFYIKLHPEMVIECYPLNSNKNASLMVKNMSNSRKRNWIRVLMQKQQVLKLQHLLQVNNAAKEEETGK